MNGTLRKNILRVTQRERGFCSPDQGIRVGFFPFFHLEDLQTTRILTKIVKVVVQVLDFKRDLKHRMESLGIVSRFLRIWPANQILAGGNEREDISGRWAPPMSMLLGRELDIVSRSSTLSHAAPRNSVARRREVREEIPSPSRESGK